jgi:hypothetical protein
MKLSEIFTEASIFTKPERYPYGHKVRVAAGSKKGKALLDMIQAVIPDFKASEDLEWVASGPKDNIIDVSAGADVGWFKRPDGTTFGIKGSGKVWEKCLTHAPGQKGSTAENKGDLSEPVLSAAVVAKLIKRGADRIDDITEDDVKNVLNNAIASHGQTFSVNDKDSKIADNITFTIALRAPTLEFMADPRFWEVYGKLLPSAVHYANSGQIDRYADYFYLNGKADSIVIRSDGQSEQKSRKTDIEATVNGRKLKNLNISLKAGSPHIGQVGGGQLNNPTAEKGIWFNANRLFGPLGVDIPQPKRNITSKVEYWVKAYKIAAAQLKKDLAGKDAKEEAGIIKRISDMATNHGTSGDPNVKLVSLHPTGGKSSVHSFKNLYNKLIVDDIDLSCEYREGVSKVTGDPRPELRIFDKTSGQPLLYIRYSSTEDEKKIWNTIEMKDMLKRLTTLTYTKSTRPEQQLAPANEPVVAQPAPEVEPQASGIPSGMNTIAPATDTVQPTEPDESNPAELDRIKKNAGIQVE